MISGIQFWVTDYMKFALQMKDETAYICYILTAITAPFMGVLCGGAATQMVGGYKSPNALKMLTLVALTGTAVAIPLPLLNSHKAYLALFWMCLFLGGFINPGLTGYMIHDAPKKE